MEDKTKVRTVGSKKIFDNKKAFMSALIQLENAELIIIDRENKYEELCKWFTEKTEKQIHRLPCDVEDELYVIENGIEKVKVNSIEITKSGVFVCAISVTGKQDIYTAEDFGEFVFTDRNEAEQALKKLKQGG